MQFFLFCFFVLGFLGFELDLRVQLVTECCTDGRLLGLVHSSILVLVANAYVLKISSLLWRNCSLLCCGVEIFICICLFYLLVNVEEHGIVLVVLDSSHLPVPQEYDILGRSSSEAACRCPVINLWWP